MSFITSGRTSFSRTIPESNPNYVPPAESAYINITNQNYGVACDGFGNVYMVSGYSTSAGISNFAQNPSGTAGTLPVMSNQGAFIAKWNSSGVYQGSAYVDGTGYEQGYEVVCDGSGNVYLAGLYIGVSAAISNFNVNPSGTAGTLQRLRGFLQRHSLQNGTHRESIKDLLLLTVQELR